MILTQWALICFAGNCRVSQSVLKGPSASGFKLTVWTDLKLHRGSYRAELSEICHKAKPFRGLKVINKILKSILRVVLGTLHRHVQRLTLPEGSHKHSCYLRHRGGHSCDDGGHCEHCGYTCRKRKQGYEVCKILIQCYFDNFD